VKIVENFSGKVENKKFEIGISGIVSSAEMKSRKIFQFIFEDSTRICRNGEPSHSALENWKDNSTNYIL